MKYTGLSGKKVLVTGGTRGIGFAIAEAFVEQDAVVHVSGKTKLGAGPSGTVYHSCDFTSSECLDHFGLKLKTLELDILINNAGINKISPFVDITTEDYLRIQQVNLSVTSIDQNTQRNAAFAEESSAISIKMAEEAKNLIDIVEYFKIST